MDARERKRYEVLVDLSAGGTFEPDEMCGCLSMPLNYFLHPDGTWSSRSTLGDGALDAIAFVRSRCVGWVIGCPRCSRLFAAGVKVPNGG